MTTSNHRPYTYPSGRIDIPSGQGRDGAVKYTDYAIGEFLAQARKKPWFDSTVFVFVADHTTGSAGKEDLPVASATSRCSSTRRRRSRRARWPRLQTDRRRADPARAP